MNPNHEDLLQRLGALKNEFSELGSWLCQAGEELQRHGALPRPNLPEKLTAARESFLNFRLELLKWIQSLRFPETTSIQQTTSLKDCEELLQATSKAEAMRRRSLEVLRRAALLAHQKQADSPALLALQATVHELQLAIAQTEILDLHPDCQALAEGVHPIATLLTLVENRDKSQDNLWIALLRTVQPSLDAELLEAIKNSELFIQTETSNSSPQEKNGPAGTKAAPITSHKVVSKPAAPAEPAPSPLPPAPRPELSLPAQEPAMLFSERNVVDLAGAILDKPVPERGALVQNLIWHLLFEDKLSLAYHLAHSAEQQGFVLQPRLPSWLMRALVWSRHLCRPDGEIGRLLQADFTQCQEYFGAAAYSADWQKPAHLLLAAACLRPALLAPAATTRPLQVLRIEDQEQFRHYFEMLLRFGTAQAALNFQALKKRDGRTPGRVEPRVHPQETAAWQQAKKEWENIESHRNAVLHELDTLAQSNSSLPLAASLLVCRRAVENVHTLLGLERELPADEPDAKTLLHAGFWKASATLNESHNPPLVGSSVMLGSLLNFLAGREEKVVLQVSQAQFTAQPPKGDIVRQDKAWLAEAQNNEIRRDQRVIEAGPGNPGTFDDFFPNTFRLIWEYLEPAKAGKSRNFEIVNNIRKYAKGLTQNCAIGPVQIPHAHAEEVAEVLEIWFSAEKTRRVGEDAVQQLWNRLGFNTTKITKHTLGNRTWFDVITSPLLDQERCPVPAYGAIANGSYRVICVWARSNESRYSSMELIHHTEDTPAGTAVIFLYFGGLSEQQRHALGQLCREHRRTFIVIDTLLLIYLSSLDKVHWLPALFKCTLPFTFLASQSFARRP